MFVRMPVMFVRMPGLLVRMPVMFVRMLGRQSVHEIAQRYNLHALFARLMHEFGQPGGFQIETDGEDEIGLRHAGHVPGPRLVGMGIGVYR